MNKLTKPVISFVFWIGVWAVCAAAVDKEVLLPHPSAVAVRLWELLGEGSFYTSVAMSFLRILAGYAAGFLLGVLFAFASFYLKLADIVLAPMLTAARATPVASFIILALVWMGRGIVPSFTAALMVLPVVYGSVGRGLSSTDAGLSEVAEVYGFGFFKKLRLLHIPSAVPSMISSAKTSLGLAWKAGVAAEVLCTPKSSIGGEIYSSKLYLESTDLFAWTAAVIAFSLLLELLLSATTSGIYKKFTIGEVNDERK